MMLSIGPACGPARAKVYLLRHCAEFPCQFKQRHSRVDFRSLIREFQTFFGVVSVFPRCWHDGDSALFRPMPDWTSSRRLNPFPEPMMKKSALALGTGTPVPPQAIAATTSITPGP
jgi:hypothetical protein